MSYLDHEAPLCSEISPPRRRAAAKILRWTLRLCMAAPLVLAGLQWGARIEARQRLVEPHRVAPQARGELWLRCPSSRTWYSYVGSSGWTPTQMIAEVP